LKKRSDVSALKYRLRGNLFAQNNFEFNISNKFKPETKMSDGCLEF